jgi:hypothetical protein
MSLPGFFELEDHPEAQSRAAHEMLKRFFCGVMLSLALALTAANPARARSAELTVPNDVQLVLMIKTILIAFNQANVTGNYTVLRELAAPDFQMRNTPARLGEIFQTERNKNFDLSPVVLLRPDLVRKPVIDQQGRLHLEGIFASQPQMVHFVLVFQSVATTWRMVAISVSTFVPQAPQASRPNTDVIAANAKNQVVSSNEVVRGWAGNVPAWNAGLR